MHRPPALRSAHSNALVHGLGLAACGGDDDTTEAGSEAADTTGDTATEDTTEATSPNGAESVVGDPIAVEALTACLEEAGLTPEPDNDSVMLGVEDPYYQMTVPLDPRAPTASSTRSSTSSTTRRSPSSTA